MMVVGPLILLALSAGASADGYASTALHGHLGLGVVPYGSPIFFFFVYFPNPVYGAGGGTFFPRGRVRGLRSWGRPPYSELLCFRLGGGPCALLSAVAWGSRQGCGVVGGLGRAGELIVSGRVSATAFRLGAAR